LATIDNFKRKLTRFLYTVIKKGYVSFS